MIDRYVIYQIPGNDYQSSAKVESEEEYNDLLSWVRGEGGYEVKSLIGRGDKDYQPDRPVHRAFCVWNPGGREVLIKNTFGESLNRGVPTQKRLIKHYDDLEFDGTQQEWDEMMDEIIEAGGKVVAEVTLENDYFYTGEDKGSGINPGREKGVWKE